MNHRARALTALRALLEYAVDLSLGLLERLPEPPPPATVVVPVLDLGARLAYGGRHWQVAAIQASDADLAVVCWPGSPTVVVT